MSQLSRTREPILSLEDLRVHLQWALELEHATLPPYLCALYSLDEERNRDVARILRSVFVEEMLHLTLAANLLNAVGGAPVLDAPHLLPAYPTTLPHGDRSFRISLLPFGPEALETFLEIEKRSTRMPHQRATMRCPASCTMIMKPSARIAPITCPICARL